MAFAWFAKTVRCPNCGHVGKAKLQGSGCGLLLVWGAAFIVSCYMPALLLITIPFLLWLIFRPAKMVCSKCSWPHPVPVDGQDSLIEEIRPRHVLTLAALIFIGVCAWWGSR